ncbi:efflux RND transporter periplasmic adaptor subunit [Paractinoplanes brasiliensis]|uniref:HlyD family secretion protein n=1 Tax=Paractinoplanes brasiliensis TaxID=52695 RepID=A0A4R6K043_9ACTN|nr:efflux RND transporter periplasmic adaptor subunit [Actinoplanes brasiliensis]TDO42553.1 HlyD family secretion protein [Actinoplanes brasiliensis]
MGEARAGRRRWVRGAAAVVVSALIAFGVGRALTAGAETKPVAAATVAADRGAVTSEVATTGTVQPAQTHSLSFGVAGTVETIAVRAGTAVTAGQVLARVDDADAAEAVDDAQDALDDAEDALAEAEKSAAAPATCGSNVAAAYTSPSAGLSPTSAVPAVTPSARPTTTGPAAAPSRTTSPARTPAGSAPTSGTCAGDRGQPGGDAVLSAQQRVNQATVALDKAEKALAGATLKAPVAGRILSVAGKVGSRVSAGNAFITLADVQDMQISANFPEADADRLAAGQKAVVAPADRAGQWLPATVVQVDPVGTGDGAMVRYGVLLSFDAAPKDLLVGQSASVRVTTGSKAEALRVPSTAVHDVSGDQGTVLRNGAPTKVVIGLRGDQYTEIAGGLSEGDEIVRSW